MKLEAMELVSEKAIALEDRSNKGDARLRPLLLLASVDMDSRAAEGSCHKCELQRLQGRYGWVAYWQRVQIPRREETLFQSH